MTTTTDRQILVGITGRAGAGKDTLAAAFISEMRHLKRSAFRMAFADRLRDVAAALFGRRFETRAEKDAPQPFWQERLGDRWATGRGILQQLGTEVFRAYDQDFWVHQLVAQLTAYPAHVAFIVPDVRFDNEADMIRNLGGVVVELVRDDIALTIDSHASEAGVEDANIDERYITTSVAETEAIGQSLARRMALRWPAPTAEDLPQALPAAEDLTPARPAEEAAP